jgi:hypothetical protein
MQLPCWRSIGGRQRPGFLKHSYRIRGPVFAASGSECSRGYRDKESDGQQARGMAQPAATTGRAGASMRQQDGTLRLQTSECAEKALNSEQYDFDLCHGSN